jgi:uncharacterized protein YbjT (DUF2867 family)
VDLAVGQPTGRVPDLVGPQVLSFADVVRGYLTATGRRRPVASVWMPGIGEIRRGALLPAVTEPSRQGTRTWTDFLENALAVADRRVPR